MTSKTWGRVEGALLLVQLAGLIGPFVMLDAAVGSRFLGEAAARGATVQTATAWLLGNAVLALAIALITFASLRRRHVVIASALVAVSLIWITLQTADNSRIRSMVRLSEQVQRSGTGITPDVESRAAATRKGRTTVHYWTLVAIEAWFATLYLALMRARHIPRALGIFGIVMVALHVAGVTAPKFLHFAPTFALAPSLALSHLAIGGWLLVRGFAADRQDS